jgi:hypothetical protein
MMIAIEDWQLYAIIGVAGLMMMGSIMLYLIIKSNAPDAFTHWKAARTGAMICRVHFRGRGCSDYIATQDQTEKELGANFWNVKDLGIKFKPEPDEIEFIEGGVRCANYYEKLPKAIKMSEVIALSNLKTWFKKIGISIDGIENVALYVAQEAEKMPGTMAERAIKNARIDSEETRKYLKNYLAVLNNKHKEASSLVVESGIFTFQTAMSALSGTLAYTSSAVMEAIEVTKAAILRREENKRKDMIMMAIIAVILAIAGVILLIGIKQVV